MGNTVTQDPTIAARLPPRVLVLGVISLLTAVSSAMILGLLPVFLVAVLGASMTSVGIIEGIAGAGMSIAKVIAGPVSDWLGRRKPLLLLGYGMSAVVKLVFPVADNAIAVLFARALDRVGKGLRDAPRDAFVADITPQPIRGSGFGLRAALYTLGFVIGPLAAIGLMKSSGDDYRLVFWVAVLPAVAGIALLILGVKETAEVRSAGRRTFDRAQLAKLAAPFWWIVAIASMFSLARFSQAFLVLKTHEIGVQVAYLPVIIAVMHVVYSISAYPCGVMADRVSPRIQLAVTGVILIVADVVLAGATAFWVVALGSALWGLQMGLSYGLLKAAVADIAPKQLSGTAFGIYDCAIGITTFLASAVAGLIWTSRRIDPDFRTWRRAGGGGTRAGLLLADPEIRDDEPRRPRTLDNNSLSRGLECRQSGAVVDVDDVDVDFQDLAVTVDLKVDGPSDADMFKLCRQVIDAFDRLSIGAHNDISGRSGRCVGAQQTRPLRRGSGRRLHDKDALDGATAIAASGNDANAGGRDAAGTDQFGDDAAHHADRNGEAEGGGRLPAQIGDRIDTDEPARGIEKRSSRVSRKYRRVGLDHVGNLATPDGRQLPSERAYHACRERLIQTKWISDRIDKLTDLQFIRAAVWDRSPEIPAPASGAARPSRSLAPIPRRRHRIAFRRPARSLSTRRPARHVRW